MTETTFTSNQAQALGIYDTDWSWGATFSDFNHDGYEDLFVANGLALDVQNRFFINTSE